MRRFRVVMVATVLAGSLIAPSAILAEQPAPGETAVDGAVAVPQQNPAPPEQAAGEGKAAPAEAAVADAVPVAAPSAAATLRASAEKGGGAPASASAAAASVAIQDYYFSPKKVTIDTGESVKWTNKGKVPEGHTATGDSFDSGVLKKGQSYTHKFTKAGSFDYICTLHPNMTGTVVVKAASGGGGNDNGGSSDGGTGGGTGTSGTSSGLGGTGSTSSLPITGQDLRLLLVLGVNLLLAGTLLLLRSRCSGSG